MNNETVVAGMTYMTYDSDRDSSGEIGMALADAELLRVGGDFNKIRKRIILRRNDGMNVEVFKRAARIYAGGNLVLRPEDTLHLVSLKSKIYGVADRRYLRDDDGNLVLLAIAPPDIIGKRFREDYNEHCGELP